MMENWHIRKRKRENTTQDSSNVSLEINNSSTHIESHSESSAISTIETESVSELNIESIGINFAPSFSFIFFFSINLLNRNIFIYYILDAEKENNVSVIGTDISEYVKKPPSNHTSILECYDGLWAPNKNYPFPLLNARGNKKLKYQISWLDRFSWLAYSDVQKGAYCKVCVFFGKKVGGVGNQKLLKLVTEPHNNCKDAIENYRDHEKKEYHKDALLRLENRRRVETGDVLPVNLQLEQQNHKITEENKKKNYSYY